MRYMIIFVLTFVFAWGLNPSDLQKLETIKNMTREEFRTKVCANLDKNSLFAIKCSPDNEAEVLQQANAYISKHGKPAADTLGPVIILPGLGGSAMQGSINKEKAPHWWCWSKWEEWFRLWLPLTELINQDCWFDNLQILYDINSNSYSSPPGVTTQVIDFGGTSGIDYLDYWFGSPISFTTYYSSLIKSLQAVGYKTGQNLFGAPFDWRKPTTALDDFFANFKALIERASAQNGGKRVHILAHSMGCTTSLQFLSLQSQAWLDRFVASYLPIAGPWAGSARALKTTISGDNFGIQVLGINILSTTDICRLSRTSGGIVELVPNGEFYPPGTVFVKQGSNQYTADQFDKLYTDIGAPVTKIIYDKTRKLSDGHQPPKVRTFCIYGSGLNTEISFTYNNGWNKDPVIDYSDKGDGTVPSASLKACELWKNQQQQPVEVREFNLLGHNDILEDSEVFEYIINIITTIQ